MTQDLSGNPPPLVRPGSPVPRVLMLTGVAGACVLGVAAGLWARPIDTERRGVMIARPAAAPPQRQLQIVVDDTPAPIGDPMEVLSQEASRPQPNFALPPPLPVIQPSAGLMKVTATAPLQVSEPPESEAPPAPRRIEPVPRVVLKAAAPKPAKAVLARPRIKAGTSEKKAVPTLAKPAKVARSEPVKIAKVKPRAEAKARPKAAKLVLAKAETKARPEAKLQTARKQAATAEANRKLVQAKAEKRAEAAKAAKLAKASQAKVAKVAKAREAWLAKLAAAEKARAAENLRVARAAEERRQAQVRLAAVKRAKAQAASKAKAAGLRVAAAPRCADPLVCGSATVADRRMSAAYRQAEAAGVPQSELRRQHERWLSARNAAAREAPWAVPDVYQERIAELRDQARDAQGGY